MSLLPNGGRPSSEEGGNPQRRWRPRPQAHCRLRPHTHPQPGDRNHDQLPFFFLSFLRSFLLPSSLHSFHSFLLPSFLSPSLLLPVPSLAGGGAVAGVLINASGAVCSLIKLGWFKLLFLYKVVKPDAEDSSPPILAFNPIQVCCKLLEIRLENVKLDRAVAAPLRWAEFLFRRVLSHLQ